MQHLFLTETASVQQRMRSLATDDLSVAAMILSLHARGFRVSVEQDNSFTARIADIVASVLDDARRVNAMKGVN